VNLRILGCHGSDALLQYATGPHRCNTCSFLLNGTLLLDAGTVASKLLLSEQERIRHIILSHLHFDHIKELPTLADNLSEQMSAPIVVAGIPEVVHGLQRHIFNTDVYPDFFSIPTPERPTLTSLYLKPGNVYSFSGVDITPILVNHTVPTTGFIVQDRSSAFVYSGDTYSTDELWHEAKYIPHLKTAFIECSFPNSMIELARTSKHLTPVLLAQEYRKLDRDDISVYAYHLKPAYKDQILRELRELHIPSLEVLEEDQTLTI
jgi:ribonuclease BN (tRNA processing enzyme)